MRGWRIIVGLKIFELFKIDENERITKDPSQFS